MNSLSLKLMLASLALMLTGVGCVTTTPIGDVVVDGSISLEPQVVYSSRSRVTVSIGPSYTIDDAFYLANNHCRGYGYYAVPSSTWDHTYHSPRNLVYYCRRRPVVLHTPPVIVDRPYHHPRRYHRPLPPSVTRPGVPAPPRSGWWSRNQKPPAVVTPPPPVVTTKPPSYTPPPAPPASRPERETRSTTTTSPWSYNPRKNEESRSSGYSKPSLPSAPSGGGGTSSAPGWWGKNQKK